MAHDLIASVRILKADGTQFSLDHLERNGLDDEQLKMFTDYLTEFDTTAADTHGKHKEEDDLGLTVTLSSAVDGVTSPSKTFTGVSYRSKHELDKFVEKFMAKLNKMGADRAAYHKSKKAKKNK